MAMTMTEKILARHAGRKSVAAGDNIWVDVDILMTHDVCGPGTIGIFHKQFGTNAKVWTARRSSSFQITTSLPMTSMPTATSICSGTS